MRHVTLVLFMDFFHNRAGKRDENGIRREDQILLTCNKFSLSLHGTVQRKNWYSRAYVSFVL